MRTYGTLHVDGQDALRFEVEAHVAIRLDRVFREARIRKDGSVALAGTPSNLVDVDWFLQRYPMIVKRRGRTAGRQWIAERAAAQRDLMDEVLTILEGGGHPAEVDMALPPRDYQLRAAHALKQTGRLLCADELGLGKAQPLDAKVLTPTGWTLMGDLAVGDLVVDPDGGFGAVTEVYDRGDRQAYALTTKDGATTECCEEHLWTVQTHNDRNREATRTITTKDMVDAGLRCRTHHRQFRFLLPLTQPTAGDISPEIDPYLIGFLIGDGCLKARGVSVSVADPEILDRITSALPAEVTPKHIKGVDYRLTSAPGRPNSLLDTMRDMGLSGKRSYEKRLPPHWIEWSAESRLELLRGLMDSDGTCHANGSATTFTSTSLGLAGDVRELVGSLGGFASMGNRVTQYTHKGEKKSGRRSYRLNIRVPKCPFWVSRKQSRWRPPFLARTVISITPTSIKPMRCIAVSTARNLYVTDGFIVTHNTVTALTALAAVKAFPAVAVVPPHLCAQWARECKRFLPDLRVHVATKKYPYDVECDLLILSYFKTYHWGLALKGKIRTIIFDECQELRRDDSSKYEGCKLLALRASYRLGLSATPIYNYGGEFFNVFNIIAPDALGTWGEFIKAWCLDYSERRKARLANPQAFGAYLREMGLMVRRTRAQVARDLPGLTRAVEYVEYDDRVMRKESAGALDLARRVMERQGSNFDLMRASAELSMKARQATGIAKAPAVAAFIRMLVEESGEPVVVFAWHRAVYDYFARVLDDLGLAWHTGHESTTKKQQEIQRFLDGTAKVLVMSLRSGQGVDGLQQVCQRVVIAELDWSPGVIEQCIGRVYRDGQAEPVIAYYLLTNGGSDPVIADVLGVKAGQAKGVREPFGEDDVPAEADPEHVKKLAAAYLKKAGVPIPRDPRKVPVPL